MRNGWQNIGLLYTYSWCFVQSWLQHGLIQIKSWNVSSTTPVAIPTITSNSAMTENVSQFFGTDKKNAIYCTELS